MYPKICIVFNGGAMGDFFTKIISEQVEKDNTAIVIDDNGTVLNSPGKSFKLFCEHLVHNKTDNNCLLSIAWSKVVNSHHCTQDIIDIFPECKFYYIDESGYLNLTLDAYITKRLMPKYNNLSEYFYKELSDSIQDSSILKNLNDDIVRRRMVKDWLTNLSSWKKLGLPKVNIQNIVDKERCRHTVEMIINCEVDNVKFNKTYDQYASKNIDMIERING